MNQRYRNPAKRLSQKEHRKIEEQTSAIFADLKRQARPSYVLTKETLHHFGKLKIRVPDNDDWYVFCADLLSQGQTHWWGQKDRLRRLSDGDPKLPVHKTWAAWKKDLLRVGKLYWDGQAQFITKPGRPNIFNRCWKAFLYGVKPKSYKISEVDLIPRVNGHPITQGEVVRIIRTNDPELSLQVCRKYGRALHIMVTKRYVNEGLTKEEDAYLTKYILPVIKRQKS